MAAVFRKLPKLPNLNLEVLLKSHAKNPVFAADSHFNPENNKSVHAFILFQPKNSLEPNLFGLKIKDPNDGEGERVDQLLKGDVWGTKGLANVEWQKTKKVNLETGPIQAELTGYVFTCSEADALKISDYYLVMDCKRVYDLLVNGLKEDKEYKIDLKMLSTLSDLLSDSNGNIVWVERGKLAVADLLNKVPVGKATEDQFLKEYRRCLGYRT